MQVVVGLRAHGEVKQADAAGEGLALVELDLPLHLQIGLASEDDDGNAVTELRMQLLDLG